MNYTYDTFLKPLSTGDTTIQIKDVEGVIQWIIDPFSVINVMVNNNLLKINIKNRVIIVGFSSINESKLALSLIQGQLDTLKSGVPNFIDKRVETYVNSIESSVVSDGNTITGDGTTLNPLTANFSSNIEYSNTLFVDLVNGNDTTATPGRFDLPYQSISSARYNASILSPAQNNRFLIYLRPGRYNEYVYLSNYIDYYSEPGVVFDGTVKVSDALGSCVSNFFGYASFINSALNVLELNNQSVVTFEFDYINTSGRSIGLIPSGGQEVSVIIKGNYIISGTIGAAHGITIRNNSNVVIDIKQKIEAPHSVIEFRSHSGSVNINSPKINLLTTDIYGGNFKQAIIVYGGLSNSNIKINADLINLGDQVIGSNTGMCVLWGGTAGKFELNGNIIAGNILAVHSNNNTTGVVKITGDTTSSYVSSIWAYGNSSYDFILNGGRHIINGTVSNGVVAINGSAMTFLNNASFYNLVSDSDILSLNNASSSIILSNCLGVSEGSLGYAIKGVAVGSVYIHSSRFNKILDPTLTDLYTPSGLIVDTLTKVPKF